MSYAFYFFEVTGSNFKDNANNIPFLGYFCKAYEHKD
jgi:hypothetical protein